MATLKRPHAIRAADTARDFSGIVALYRELGWSHAADPSRLRIAVERSAFSIVAVDEDDAVIGFARALSDDAFAVYIADVLVRPSRQRQGIGRALWRPSWIATRWSATTTRCSSPSAARRASTGAWAWCR